MTYKQNTNKKTFIINGGIGRVVCSIPALMRYYNRGHHDFNVIVYGWEQLFWNNPKLQQRTYGVDQRGLFNLVIKDSTVVYPEPYFDRLYYNQESHMVSAFDRAINNDTILQDDSVSGCLFLHSNERLTARRLIDEAKKKYGKSKFIVFQPYGSAMDFVNGEPYDYSNRSFSVQSAMELATSMAKDAVVLYFGDEKFIHPKDNVMMNTKGMSNIDLRFWMAIISECDYFVGCDSSGQHIARAFNKYGMVALGPSSVDNISYKEWFYIYRKENSNAPVYAPLRLSDVDVKFANQLNDGLMNFEDNDIKNMYDIIKVGLESV